jgi:hypothetical protein
MVVIKMNNTHIKINGNKLFRGVSFSIGYALMISTGVMLVMLTISTMKGSLPSPIINLIPIFFLWMITVAIVTFFIAVFIGIPITIILIKLGLDDEWISAFTGALLVFYVIFVSEGTTSSALVFTFYGLCCAYAFMKGYKKS